MRITKCLLPVLAVTATATTLAGCSNDPTPGDRPALPLTGTHWTVDAVTVDGARTPPAPGAATRAYVEFKPDGTLTGTSGCNGFSGKADITGDTVTVAEVTRTEMACDKAVQDFENAFFKALDGKLRAKLTDSGEGKSKSPMVVTDRLTLTTPGGDTLALSEQPPMPLKDTLWRVESLLDGKTAGSLPAGVRSNPYLTVTKSGRASGYLGCNTFTATVKVEGDKMTFGALAVTRRMCTTLQNGLEQKLYGTLGSGPVTYRIQGHQLTVTAQDGSGFVAKAVVAKADR